MTAPAQQFFTADWHLGDSRVPKLGRPFADTREMNEHIIAEHNKLVSPADTVYVLGDALKSSGPQSIPSLATVQTLARFHGQLVLIRGNSDTLPDSAYAPYVQRVVADGDGIELDVDGVACWLTHHPTQARADRFKLVAHVHGAWRTQPNSLNVGVDVHHFRPVSAAQVRFYYDAICGIYDDDVWAHTHPANRVHDGRGRPGRYFRSSAR